MKLRSLDAQNYRSLRRTTVELDDLNLFIGANASGKSTILDALRFLHEATRARDFGPPAAIRGGILHLAWKGEHAQQVGIAVTAANGDTTYEWKVRLVRRGHDFRVEEQVNQGRPHAPPSTVLSSEGGCGWWWSGDESRRVVLRQAPTACALTAAAADASFPARDLADYANRWGFFDPNPHLLRRDAPGGNTGQFDPYGRNLAETLHALSRSSPETLEAITRATRSMLGLPSRLEPRDSEGGFYFVQDEPGLRFPVHQVGASSGTLRMLALMAVLQVSSNATLIGIEEPENHVHPTALSSFVEYLKSAAGRIQFAITTHSPLLLDYLALPEAVRIVRRGADGATHVRQPDAAGVRKALEESGFGLGEFHETKGFGAAPAE